MKFFKPIADKIKAAQRNVMPTVKRAFNEVMSLAEAECRHETVKSYKACFKSFLGFARAKKIDLLPIAALEPKHIIAYLDTLSLEGKSAYTFNGHLNMLRATANKLVARGLCAGDFTKGIKRRKQQQASNTPFEKEEMPP